MIRRLRALAHRVAAALSGRTGDDDFAAELESHLALHTADNIRRGLTPDEARRQALLKLGGVAQVRESVRARRGLPRVETLGADLRYAVRQARRSPAFAAAIVVTIAVGTGANAAIFSLVHDVLIASLPVQRPEELVSITSVVPSGRVSSFSYPMYRDLRDRNTVFTGVVARGGAQVSVSDGGRNDKVRAELVSGNYFDVLGVRPALGRLLTPEDDRVPGAHAVVVVSYAYWQRRFGGDPAIVGRAILLNERPMTVIGVSQPGFYGTDLSDSMDLQIPLMETPIFNPVPATRLANRNHLWLTLMARRRPGVSLAQAQASADVLARGIWETEAAGATSADARADRQQQRLVLENGAQGRGRVQRDLRLPLLLLFAVTAVVLLVVCANLANLLLARAVAREGELAMRVALGASRGRLVTQGLVEALLLCTAGALGGLMVASWGHAVLVAAMPEAVRANLAAPIEWPALALLGGITAALAVVLGLVPALRAGGNVATAIRRDTTVGGGATVSLRGALVVAQVALAVPLLVGAVLLGRSLVNLMRIDLGFRHDRVLVATVNPSLNGYSTARARSFYRTLLDDVRATHGVEGAALSTDSPISGSWDRLRLVIEGYHPQPGERVTLMASSISDGYFAALGIDVVAGREFTSRDVAGAQPVAVINETAARAYFGHDSPIGRHVGLEGTADTEIVGVVRDAKYVDVREAPERHFYLPVLQEPRLTELTLLVRTADGDPLGLVRRAVGQLDAHLPVFNARMLDQQINESMLRERMTTWLCGAFSLLATFLAALGLYGVVAFSTARRAREFGLRIALGAGTGRILASAVRQTIAWVGTGLVLGIGASIAARKALSGLLFGVTPGDPVAISLALVALIASAAIAAFLPARRATRVDPMAALRCD